jgi:plasmid stability protein
MANDFKKSPTFFRPISQTSTLITLLSKGGCLVGTVVFTAFLLINDCNDISDCMSSITIRNLESNVKNRLRMRAARHGRSMEEEARDILRAALAEKTSRPVNLFEAIRRRIGSLGGVELHIPARGPIREPPRFEE